VQRSRQAILDATRQLLAPDGDVGALTVEAVAARAGVAKTTIYRRWRDKWQLALGAVMIDMLPPLDDPVDVGDTRKGLLTFVDSVVKVLATPPDGPAMQGLVSRIATDADLGRVYRDQVVQPRHAQLAPVIQRGIARGDLRPYTDVRLLHELLVGPIPALGPGHAVDGRDWGNAPILGQGQRSQPQCRQPTSRPTSVADSRLSRRYLVLLRSQMGLL